eukprot:1436608-Prymnesium_polylepis.1
MCSARHVPRQLPQADEPISRGSAAARPCPDAGLARAIAAAVDGEPPQDASAGDRGWAASSR